MSTLASLRAEVARTIAALPEVFRSCSADVLCDVIAPEFTEDDHNRCAHSRIPPQLPFPRGPIPKRRTKTTPPPNGARADPRGFRAHPDRSTSQTPDRGPIPSIPSAQSNEAQSQRHPTTREVDRAHRSHERSTAELERRGEGTRDGGGGARGAHPRRGRDTREPDERRRRVRLRTQPAAGHGSRVVRVVRANVSGGGVGVA